jgi:hypothetical protein
MVKNKEFEYCSWKQNEWGWNFQNVWIRPLWYAFLRYLESYYCILRWKNWIRGSFYKHFFLRPGVKNFESVAPPMGRRDTGTTLIFWGALDLFRRDSHKCAQREFYVGPWDRESCWSWKWKCQWLSDWAPTKFESWLPRSWIHAENVDDFPMTNEIWILPVSYHKTKNSFHKDFTGFYRKVNDKHKPQNAKNRIRFNIHKVAEVGSCRRNTMFRF